MSHKSLKGNHGTNRAQNPCIRLSGGTKGWKSSERWEKGSEVRIQNLGGCISQNGQTNVLYRLLYITRLRS
jgi:hypothetical protein